MRIATSAGLLGLLVLSTLGAVTPGCGGGGGGGGGDGPCSTSAAPVVPVVLQGDSVPGTVSGVFPTFPPDVVADVAATGWVAFVADVSGDPSASKGVFVVTPSGIVVTVFLDDQNAPA